MLATTWVQIVKAVLLLSGAALLALLVLARLKGQNVAFMVSLAFAIAASANFPALILSIFWPRCTTAGAVAAMGVGTVATLTFIALSPTVQVELLGGTSAWFPLRNPALVTIPLAFATGVLVSLRTPERDARARYAAVERRMLLGDDRL
jgi:cation/acetate symporter